MSEEILCLVVKGPNMEDITSTMLSKDQAVEILCHFRDQGIEVYAVNYGQRALFVGTQAEPVVYNDYLDWKSVLALTGGML